jgi:hypothetical protein
MKSVRACLLSCPAVAVAQDTLPPGDVAIFSVFHARLVAAEELGTWAAGRLENDKARGTARKVRAIFVDGKRLEHKKARGVESSLRWAWGNAYSFACALRTWFDHKTVDGRELECGPPSERAEGRATAAAPGRRLAAAAPVFRWAGARP